LLRLLEQGHDLENALEIVSDPTAIVVMYAAAAVGYLIDWSVAGLVANILFQKAISRQKAIKERQKAMVERWGMEVSGQIPLDPHGFPLDMGQNPVNSKGRDSD
ncbi:MAG: hypothetical protein IT558_00910, partial [Alphaproteobacteria bacterium]|nr:hypothetical protein [Alphaproteobacteria bacterium]